MSGTGMEFVITREDATARIARVRLHVEQAWDDLIALHTGRAWMTLGYDSWDALCEAEFDGARIALPRDDRREVVGQMREAGMSTRAIASAVGVSDITVRRDLDATATDVAVDTITGLDGKTRPAHVTTTSRTTEATKVEQTVDLDTGEVIDAGRGSADHAVDALLAGDDGLRQLNLMRDVSRCLTRRPPIDLDPVEAASLPFEAADIAAFARARDDFEAWFASFMRARGSGLRVISGGAK